MIDPVNEMLIEHKCQRLVLLYGKLNDLGDWASLADTFTEDATFTRPTAPDEIIKGRQKILESFQSRPNARTQHIITNIIVEVESEFKAHSTCTVQLYIGEQSLKHATATHKLPQPVIGQYFDRFIIDNNKCYFTERRGILTIK
jgi:hypothetical protein